MVARRCVVLPDGLKLVTIELPHLHYCEFIIYIRMGSRYETRKNNGISHFLEHMLFRGNAKYPDPEQAIDRIDQIGGSVNAFTSKLATSINLHILPRFLDEGLDLISSFIQQPLFKDIDTERRIVIEELLEEKNDKGEDANPENSTRKLAFTIDASLAFPIIGTDETIKSFSKKELMTTFKRTYTKNNMVLCCIGKFDPEFLINKVSRSFASIPIGTLQALPGLPPLAKGPGYEFIENSGTKNDLLLSFVCPSELEEDFSSLLLLKRYLDNNKNANLYNKICTELGLAYDIQTSIDPLLDISFLDIGVSASAANIPRISNEILKILRNIKEQGISEQDLEETKTRLLFDMEYALDNTVYLSEWLGGTELYYTPQTYQERIERINSVSTETINRITRETLTPEKLFSAVVGQPIEAKHLDFSI